MPMPSMRARRSGSSPGWSNVPRARSRPVGRTIEAVVSRSSSVVPSGATLVTISSTEKNWLRNAMLPGMTTRPVIGGMSSDGTPPSSSTGKNGSAAMEKLSPGRSNCGGSWVSRARSFWLIAVNCSMTAARVGRCCRNSGVGSAAGRLIVNGAPSMLNATWKLTARKLFWSMTMPLPRISSSDSGRDVTLVTKTSLMTRMGIVVASRPSGAVASRIVLPFLTRRIPSRK